MGVQVARTHSYARFSLSLYQEFSPFNPILRFSMFVPLQFLYFALRARFLGPRFRLDFFCLFFFFFFYYFCRRRFALFSFCPFSRLHTGSLHSRASRVEGPRQGKPVSRVRVISLRRHARSSMTFRARTSRWCARVMPTVHLPDSFIFFSIGSLEMHRAGCPSPNRELRSLYWYLEAWIFFYIGV